MVYTYDIATGAVTSGPNSGSQTTIANVQRVRFDVLQRGADQTNQQVSLLVQVEDVANEAVILAQAPSVLTSMAVFNGFKPQKTLRTQAGDQVILKESGTTIATLNAVGTSFAADGDSTGKFDV